VKAWASHKLGTYFREPCVALGLVNRAGRLVGAVIFNDYEHRNVEMTMIGGPGIFFKGMAREVFGYAFDELGCNRISITIPERDHAKIKQARRWGWEIEGRKRCYYDEDNAIILGMVRAECRFL